MKVSVVTITYNSSKTVRDTINSVLAQTYKDIEFIIVDGLSNDGTIDIIKSYEPKFYGRIKWISEKDNGIYDAMNKGIKKATGDIVGILNSDDFFTSNDVIEKMISSFDNNIDAVYGDIHFIHSDNPQKCVRYYSSKMFRPFWLRFGFMPAHPSFYARRSVFDKVGLYSTDYKIASDYDMMVRMFIKHNIVAKYLNYDFVTMRLGGLSTKSIKSRLILINEDVKACRENNVYTNKIFICLKFLYKIFEYKKVL